MFGKNNNVIEVSHLNWGCMPAVSRCRGANPILPVLPANRAIFLNTCRAGSFRHRAREIRLEVERVKPRRVGKPCERGLNADVKAPLDLLIPKTLDDIIRQNRNKAEIRLASDEEKNAPFASIQPAPIKNQIEDWYFISLFPKPSNSSQVMLLGYIPDSRYPWITSTVEGIDLEHGLVITKSGPYYMLKGSEGVGEPPLDLLTSICSAMHQWGMGDYFGVPPWFF